MHVFQHQTNMLGLILRLLIVTGEILEIDDHAHLLITLKEELHFKI